MCLFGKKKKLLIIIPSLLFLIIIATIIISHIRVSVNDGKVSSSISIIGGADGPTSVFVASKIGDADDTIIAQEDIIVNQIEIQIGDVIMIAELEDNETTKELITLLEDDEIIMSASNYGGFEKVCSLGQSLTRDDEQITTQPGDIMLYSGNQIVIFYDSNSWAYTPIGKIDASASELEQFLSGDEDEVIIRLAE